jgi:hypothetical protein
MVRAKASAAREVDLGVGYYNRGLVAKYSLDISSELSGHQL